MRWTLALNGYTLTSWCTPWPQLEAHSCSAACSATQCTPNSHTWLVWWATSDGHLGN